MPANSRTPPFAVPADIKTAYRIGKGFLSDEEVAKVGEARASG
jgi:hypothetical protein